MHSPSAIHISARLLPIFIGGIQDDEKQYADDDRPYDARRFRLNRNWLEVTRHNRPATLGAGGRGETDPTFTVRARSEL